MNHTKVCSGHLTSTNKSWTHLRVQCGECLMDILITKDSDQHHLSINEALVVRAYCSGSGFSTVKTIFNVLESPFICKKRYRMAEARVGYSLKALVEEDLSKNLQKAKQHVIENNKTIENEGEKYHFTSVIVDGGCAKRSYGHSFSSNAGVGVIISEPLNEVLHMGYRIKSCKVCDSKSSEDSIKTIVSKIGMSWLMQWKLI